MKPKPYHVIAPVIPNDLPHELRDDFALTDAAIRLDELRDRQGRSDGLIITLFDITCRTQTDAMALGFKLKRRGFTGLNVCHHLGNDCPDHPQCGVTFPHVHLLASIDEAITPDILAAAKDLTPQYWRWRMCVGKTMQEMMGMALAALLERDRAPDVSEAFGGAFTPAPDGHVH